MAPEAGRTWRLLDTGASPGSFNLALDEALFEMACSGEGRRTLRFYAWSPPAVSVGYFQRWEREIDAAACGEQRLPLYRRITGGRAVLHRDEVTYSVVCPDGDGPFGEGIWPAYRHIGAGLAAGLRAIGVDAAMAPPPPRRAGGGGRHHPSCFSSTSGYELSCRGRKIAGSAQKRRGKVMLQHGSILLSGHGRDFLRLLKEKYRTAALPSSMVSLEELLGRRPAYDEVVRALVAGFRSAWGEPVCAGDLTAGEKELALRLERTNYRDCGVDPRGCEERNSISAVSS